MQRVILYLSGAIIVWPIFFFSLASAENLTRFMFGNSLNLSIAQITAPETKLLTRGLKSTTSDRVRAIPVIRTNPKAERRKTIVLLPGAGASTPR